MTHHWRIVSTTELRAAVWPGVTVGQGVLKNCIWEIRQALREDPKSPQFIEMIPRRGYRFIGPIQGAELQTYNPEPSFPSSSSLLPNLVGRKAELTQLHDCLDKARRGACQVVFVSGEQGIGKTALVEAFLKAIDGQPGIWIVHGQCIQDYGVGEAYLPVLEALEQVCQQPRGERLVKLLSRYAPTWLVRIPILLSAAELEALLKKGVGATHEPMLREMADAAAALTAEEVLVLALEDLQHSDPSTLALISFLARQRRARLLLIGTYRPVDVAVEKHPLKDMLRELQEHGQCEELSISYLSEAAVASYLARRFPKHQFSPELPRVLRQRSSGNPLFLLNVVDELVAQGVLSFRGRRWTFAGDVEDVGAITPERLKQLVNKYLDRLTPEEFGVLEVASVAGLEFSAAAVAAVVERDILDIEACCERLVRQHYMLLRTASPAFRDRRRAARYAFRHAFYRDVVYAQIPTGHREHFHRRLAAWTERTYGARLDEHTADLAEHLERGHEYLRAVQYREQAARAAAQRGAYREMSAHLTAALEALTLAPHASGCGQHESGLQTALAAALMATKGLAAPEVERAYTRARALCEQGGPQLFSVLRGLWAGSLTRADFQTAQELAQQILSLAELRNDPLLFSEAYGVLGTNFFYAGDLLAAHEHLERSLAVEEPQPERVHDSLFGQDGEWPCWRISYWGHAALTQWCRGYSEQAFETMREALARAQKLSHPYGVALAQVFFATLHQLRRDLQLTSAFAEGAISLATKHEFPLLLAMGTFLRGWVLTQSDNVKAGVVQMRKSMDAYEVTGAKIGKPYFQVLLAEAYEKSGKKEKGLASRREALSAVRGSGARLWEAELYRLVVVDKGMKMTEK
jgi:predicted ATPase